jgi:hypothetical protein
MNLRQVGVACAVALLATCASLATGCGSKATTEIVNPQGDGGVKPYGLDGSSFGSGDDATLGAAESGAPGTGPLDGSVPDDADAQTVSVPGDASCPGPDLRCHVDTCAGAATSVSGTVYDPAGKNPIPHAFVFVPTDPSGKIPVITPGTKACDTCDLPIGSYVAATMSDATGAFSLHGIPTGTRVPIVLQIGKWRRETFVSTTSCQNTVLSASDTHLPASQAQGDMPAVALLTGAVDDLGCFLSRVGIDHGEYSAPHGGGRIDVYQGATYLGTSAPGLSNGTAGDCQNTGCPLWSSKASLESYDIVLLACEGDTFDGTSDAGAGGGVVNATPASKQVLHDWLGEGGRVFATHFHYTWFLNGPSDFQGLASWKGYSIGTATGNEDIVTTFPKGEDFRTELADAGLLTNGTIALNKVADSVSSVNAPALAWLKDPGSGDPKYLTFTTPVGGTCGKVGFSDLHVSGNASGNLPDACMPQDLSPQEKAIELLFFDLSACVSDDTKAAPGPPASQ